ncbi:hypothetical protein A8144_08950 [Mycobacterium leprae 3125609]|nr:hypothetical protein A8144_08950 [Mycobacterium leprae 3125609]OAX70978.1 hypothetical protein A3216_08500 [Mycobacterium leprae 7935681]
MSRALVLSCNTNSAPYLAGYHHGLLRDFLFLAIFLMYELVIAAPLEKRRAWTLSVSRVLVSRQVLQLVWGVLKKLRLVDVTGEFGDERHDGERIREISSTGQNDASMARRCFR